MQMAEQIERLARFVAETTLEQVPKEVQRHAKLVVLDTIGVILAGASRPEVRGLRERLNATAGIGATVFAPGWPTSDPRSAALLNGIAGRSLELGKGNRYVSYQGAMQILPGVLSVGEWVRSTGRDMLELEPMTLLPALAMVTSHIGLVTTASTTYNEPYNLARRFATLDLISKGRAGWNVVASWSEHEAQNFGLETTLDYDTRYARSAEFVDVVKGLWDGWDDGALLLDKAGGRYFDEAKMHVSAAEPGLHRRDPWPTPRRPGRPASGARNRGQGKADKAAVVETGRVA
jgi:hypothetical protein